METLSGPNLEVHLTLIEGHDFGFVGTDFFIVASLDSKTMKTGRFPSAVNINLESDFIWLSTKDNIKKMKTYKVPVRVDFFRLGSTKPFGYIILSLKDAKFGPKGCVVNLKDETHKVCGTGKDAIGCHPYVTLHLVIRDVIEEESKNSSRGTNVSQNLRSAKSPRIIQNSHENFSKSFLPNSSKMESPKRSVDSPKKDGEIVKTEASASRNEGENELMISSVVEIPLEPEVPSSPNRTSSFNQAEAGTIKVFSPTSLQNVSNKKSDELHEWKLKELEKMQKEHDEKLKSEFARLSALWSERERELEKEAENHVTICQRLSDQLQATTIRVKEKEQSLEVLKVQLEDDYQSQVKEAKTAFQAFQTELLLRLKEKERTIEELQSHVQKLSTELNSHTANQHESCHQKVVSLEEQLKSAKESKEVFKEQWRRAVDELARIKMEGNPGASLKLKKELTKIFLHKEDLLS